MTGVKGGVVGKGGMFGLCRGRGFREDVPLARPSEVGERAPKGKETPPVSRAGTRWRGAWLGVRKLVGGGSGKQFGWSCEHRFLVSAGRRSELVGLLQAAVHSAWYGWRAVLRKEILVVLFWSLPRSIMSLFGQCLPR